MRPFYNVDEQQGAAKLQALKNETEHTRRFELLGKYFGERSRRTILIHPYTKPTSQCKRINLVKYFRGISNCA